MAINVQAYLWCVFCSRFVVFMCVQFDDCQLLGLKYNIGDNYGALVVWDLYGKNRTDICSLSTIDGFGGLVVSMLASGTQVCGFKPGRSRWIFRA